MENMDKNNFIDPEKVISQIDLKQGNVVADFGCGTGYFTFALAKKVGEKGIVYALDVLPQIIETIESQAKLDGIKNIITKRVNLEKESGSGLEADSLDWVILKDVLYQNQKKDILLKEAKRVLKKDGRALVIEWKNEDSSIGPMMSLRVEKEEVLKIAKEGGWIVAEEINAGKVHYCVILIK